MSDQSEATTFATLVAQGFLEIGDGYRAKLEELGGDGPIFLRAGLLREDGFDWEGAERFNTAIIPKLQSKLGVAGDTLVTTKGNSVGRTGYVLVGIPPFVYSPHLSYWRSLDQQRISSRFLYYWSRSHEFTMQLHAMAHGTDMAPYLSLRDQRRLKITLPDIAAQEALSGLLGAIDDKIAANQRIARTGEALVLTLGSGDRWTLMVTLAKIVDHVKDQVLPQRLDAERVANYSIPAYDSTRLPELVSPRGIKSGKFKVGSPSVLVSKLNPSIPRVWNVNHSPRIPALASTEFLVLRPRPGISTDELWAVCGQPGFISSLAGKVTGTSNSHQRVKPDDLLATEVVDPRGMSDEVRASISAVSAVINETRIESLALSTLRDALLPKLMSGEMRVRDAERIVEDAT